VSLVCRRFRLEHALLSLALTSTGCGPLDPVFRWEIHEAATSDGRLLRALTAADGGDLDDYDHPPDVLLVDSRGAGIVLHIQTLDPATWSAFEIDANGKSTKLPLTMVYSGMGAPPDWPVIESDVHRDQKK
jgi:hypothetical protein